jgi:hypothetical protein
MAFYLLHIPLVHALALLVALMRTPDQVGWLFAPHPMGSPPVPEGYRWSLWLLYAIAVVAVILLWFPCRALAARRGQGQWWFRLL